jgi:putative spermidine/putrescine transport system ATP-binding protein
MAGEPEACKAVELRHVTKRFGVVTALEDVSFSATEGEFVAFLGPSGCGKTTLLRILAGFEDPSAGAVLIRDAHVERLPPYSRDIGMVFQQYALFPHKTVFKNIEFGLRYRSGFPERRRVELVEEALALVRLPGYEARRPHQLSGGEQQRIALARALVTRPALLLLDEPLSNLDAKLRAEMRLELKQIHQAVGITFIFVTHDREEALSLSDRVVVMRAGRIEQVGSPRDVYERPASEHVARFMGHANLLEARVEAVGPEGVDVRLVTGEYVRAPGGVGVAPGMRAALMVRPEGVRLHSTRPAESGAAMLSGIITGMSYQGSVLYMVVRLHNKEILRAEVQNAGRPGLGLGQEVEVTFASDALWVIARNSEAVGGG